MKLSRFVLSLVLLGFVSSVTGCSSGSAVKEEPAPAGSAKAEFQQYTQDRPDPAASAPDPIGDGAADAILQGIDGIYKSSVKMTDAYIASVENTPVALKLEEVKTQAEAKNQDGKVAMQDAINQLSPADKAAYQKHLDSNKAALKEAPAMLVNVGQLAIGLAKLDVKSIVTNPLKAIGAAKSVTRATQQANFTKKSLGWLVDAYNRSQEMQSYKGR